jgi:ankyrin repeat protein
LNAWAQLGAMTKECAMRQYINRVHRLNIGLTTKTPPQAFGLRISRPIVVNDVDDDSIWFKSIKDGNYDAIREMMTNEDVIDSRDDLGMNALHWAVDRGDYRLTSLLLECPLIDVNAQDNEGQTALHIATACDHTSIIKLLIDAGADVNIVDVHGNVAQHHK